MTQGVPTELSPAAELYIWGFPLLSVQRTRLQLSSRHPTGQMHHVENLATPKDRAIVAPNNDTLYSSGWYDLRYGDLVINVPPMDKPSRYWNVMVVDAYTHVSYVPRRHHGTDGVQVRVTFDAGPNQKNEPEDLGATTVKVGTPTAWVIVRVLVESADDLHIARELQHAITVEAPAAHPHTKTERGGRATEIAQAGAAFVEELKRFVDRDPPAAWHPQLSPAAQAVLEDATCVSRDELEAGVREAEKLIKAGNSAGSLIQHGWSTGQGAGGPGNDILKRAIGARFGLGGHYAIENRSYIAVKDSDGSALDGNNTLMLHFAAADIPPCDGFWSLTAYGMDLYLVDNEIDRWSISDRTPGLNYGEDGSLTIQLSAQRPEAVSNWLPVPAGSYMLGMRVYEGHEAVVDCAWFPPLLTRV